MALSKDQVKKEDLQEIRVIIIGRTGAGKSYLGNALLGREEFHTSVIATSITDSCAFGKQEVTSGSRKYILKVIDTPGLLDNTLLTCKSLSLPGPHFFVIVIPIGRFTKEELGVVEWLKREFGEELMNFALVVFTHGSKLKNMSIQEYMKEAPQALQQVVEECQNRYEVIYDDDKNLPESVQNIIDLMVNSAKLEDYYTNDMLNQANENKKMIIAKIEEDRNKEINKLQKELEELKRKAAVKNYSIEEKMEIHKEEQRKEEELEKTKTTSPEEIYDNKVISDNSVAQTTFGGKLLTAATSAGKVVAGTVAVAGVTIVVAGGTFLAIGGTDLRAGGLIATGVGALTATAMSYIRSKGSTSTTHIEENVQHRE